MTNHTPILQKRITRRNFIRISAAIGGAVIGGGVYRIFNTPHQTLVHDARLLMGTIINMTVVADNPEQGRAATASTFAVMSGLTQYFDYRQTASQLGRLNLTGELRNPSTELVSILKVAIGHGQMSSGAFDITVLPILNAYRANRKPTPQDLQLVNYQAILVQDDYIKLMKPGMAITLDGIAKGRVLDSGVSHLKSLGYENILVEAGGDLLANGTHPDGEAWKIGMINPRSVMGTQWLATFNVTDRAVATSGDYQDSFTKDYSINHIIDPHTGMSPTELAGATTIASSVMEADAISTTLMVLGVKEGLNFVEQLAGVEAFLVTKDLHTYHSSGFPSL